MQQVLRMVTAAGDSFIASDLSPLETGRPIYGIGDEQHFRLYDQQRGECRRRHWWICFTADAAIKHRRRASNTGTKWFFYCTRRVLQILGGSRKKELC
ncbi:hypothetical protein MRX96_010029 [Rhipicephalus microplus]